MLVKILEFYQVRETYNQAVSIIQSSGTGKSRGMEEVAKIHFTFLFNLMKNNHGYGMQTHSSFVMDSKRCSIPSP